jgi:phage terminase small subunit
MTAMQIQSPRDRAAAALNQLAARGSVAQSEPEPQDLAEQAAPAPRQSVVEIMPQEAEEPFSAYASLSVRDQLFVDALAAGKTRAEAARMAGYEGARADCDGYRRMRRPEIQRALAERRSCAAEEAGIELHSLLRELASIAYNRVSVDSDAVRLRALETLLTYVRTPGTNGAAEQNVAQKITERFRRARLQALPAPSAL